MSEESKTPEITSATQIVRDRIEGKFKDLGGLNDICIKRLSYVVRELFGINSFKFEIMPLVKPKRIIVHVFDKNGEAIETPVDGKKTFKRMERFLGTEQYEVDFFHEDGVGDESKGTEEDTK